MNIRTAPSPAGWQPHSTAAVALGAARTGGPPPQTRAARQVGGHLGSTDDQMASVAAPSGEVFDDEPRQG